MKKYILEVVITEGNDEYWENLKGSGREEITTIVRNAIDSVFSGNAKVSLKKFESGKQNHNRIKRKMRKIVKQPIYRGKSYIEVMADIKDLDGQ